MCDGTPDSGLSIVNRDVRIWWQVKCPPRFPVLPVAPGGGSRRDSCVCHVDDGAVWGGSCDASGAAKDGVGLVGIAADSGFGFDIIGAVRALGDLKPAATVIDGVAAGEGRDFRHRDVRLSHAGLTTTQATVNRSDIRATTPASAMRTARRFQRSIPSSNVANRRSGSNRVMFNAPLPSQRIKPDKSPAA